MVRLREKSTTSCAFAISTFFFFNYTFFMFLGEMRDELVSIDLSAPSFIRLKAGYREIEEKIN